MPESVSSTEIDEEMDSLNTRKFYFLLIFVSIVGVIGALLMIAFFFLENVITGFLWNGIPVYSLSPVFNPWILVICVTGGLGAGLVRHYFNGEIAIMAEDLVEFTEKGRFDLKRGIELFLRGLVSLVCGHPSVRRDHSPFLPVRQVPRLPRKPVCHPRSLPCPHSPPSVGSLEHS